MDRDALIHRLAETIGGDRPASLPRNSNTMSLSAGSWRPTMWRAVSTG